MSSSVAAKQSGKERSTKQDTYASIDAPTKRNRKKPNGAAVEEKGRPAWADKSAQPSLLRASRKSDANPEDMGEILSEAEINLYSKRKKKMLVINAHPKRQENNIRSKEQIISKMTPSQWKRVADSKKGAIKKGANINAKKMKKGKSIHASASSKHRISLAPSRLALPHNLLQFSRAVQDITESLNVLSTKLNGVSLALTNSINLSTSYSKIEGDNSPRMRSSPDKIMSPIAGRTSIGCALDSTHRENEVIMEMMNPGSPTPKDFIALGSDRSKQGPPLSGYDSNGMSDLIKESIRRNVLALFS